MEKREAARTRRRILEILKQDGPTDSVTLAGQLSLTGMAVRQHLYDLQKNRLVCYQEERRPLGRPAKLWRLTPAADRFFPNAHADLVLSLVDAARSSLGSKGLGRIIAARARQQISQYRQRIPARLPLPQRLKRLAHIRTEEGYMAEVKTRPDGSFLLIENHCPICTAATACTGLCDAELDVFRSTLPGTEVRRIEHIVAGSRRCVYQISRPSRGQSG